MAGHHDVTVSLDDLANRGERPSQFSDRHGAHRIGPSSGARFNTKPWPPLCHNLWHCATRQQLGHIPGDPLLQHVRLGVQALRLLVQLLEALAEVHPIVRTLGHAHVAAGVEADGTQRGAAISPNLATLQGIAEEAGFRPLLMNAPDLDLAAKKLLLCPTGVRPVQA